MLSILCRCRLFSNGLIPGIRGNHRMGALKIVELYPLLVTPCTLNHFVSTPVLRAPADVGSSADVDRFWLFFEQHLRKQSPEFCWICVLSTAIEGPGLVLPLFLAAQGPASPAEQMGGQGRQQLQRLVNGQLAALPLLVSSAKTGRRQAPVGLVTAAVTSMATIDEAAASLTQCMSGDAISDVIVKCERWAPQLHRTALLWS